MLHRIKWVRLRWLLMMILAVIITHLRYWAWRKPLNKFKQLSFTWDFNQETIVFHLDMYQAPPEYTVGIVIYCSFSSQQRQGIFLLFAVSRPSVGPTHSPIQWVPGAVSMEVEQLGCGAPSSSAQVKNSGTIRGVFKKYWTFGQQKYIYWFRGTKP
jgi:hypothetical protein